MALMMVRKKVQSLLINLQIGADPLGRLHTGKSQNLHPEEYPYPTCKSVKKREKLKALPQDDKI